MHLTCVMEPNSAYSKHEHRQFYLDPVPAEQMSEKKKDLTLILQTSTRLELPGTDSKYQGRLEVLPIAQRLTLPFPNAFLARGLSPWALYFRLWEFCNATGRATTRQTFIMSYTRTSH